MNPIVVHGGGPQIAGMLKRLQLKSEFVHGLRVTDKPTVEVVEMVLAGLINKDIVTAINRQGGKAVGISGKDANLMIARKITEMPDPESNLMQAVDIGYVGDPAEVNPHIVEVISALRPDPGHRAGRPSAARARRSTSTPTRSPARWPRA